MADYNELLKEYKKLAKVADQRLVRLEKLSKQPGFEDVTNYAYKRAVYDINAWDKKAGVKTGKLPRFNRNIPTRTDALQGRLTAVQHFIDAPSSQKSRLLDIYGRAAETTNKRYGTEFTWSDMANYYETIQSKNNDAKYGSKTLIKALAIVKSVGNDPEAIKIAKRKSTILSDDEVVDEIAHKLFKAGQTASKLFGSN